MAKNPHPLRRVVTGHNAEGKSCVIFDGDAPNVYPRPDVATFFTDFWTIEGIPANLSGNEDEGSGGDRFSHSPPARGATFRIVQAGAPDRTAPRDLKAEEEAFARMNRNGLSQLKKNGMDLKTGASAPLFHRTPSVDYALNLGCDRWLVLDDSEVVVRRGDIVVQLANFHTWPNRTDEPGCMAFDMFGAVFPDEEPETK